MKFLWAYGKQSAYHFLLSATLKTLRSESNRNATESNRYIALWGEEFVKQQSRDNKILKICFFKAFGRIVPSCS